MTSSTIQIKPFSFTPLGDQVQEITWQLYNDPLYPRLSQEILPRITGTLIHAIARICDCALTLIIATNCITVGISYQVFNLIYSIQNCQRITDQLFERAMTLSRLCLLYLVDIPTAAICNAITPQLYKEVISLCDDEFSDRSFLTDSTHIPSTPGFENLGANCAFNSCLQVILHHPEWLKVYKEVAHYYHAQDNPKDKTCGKNMLDVLTAYNDALKSGKSVAEDISNKLRLAMHHLNPEIEEGSRHEDAHEILITLTGKYEDILTKEESLLTTSAIHFKNIITKHYAIGKEVEEPKNIFSTLSKDHTIVQEELQSQLKIVLNTSQKPLHFNELLQTFFCRKEENVIFSEESPKFMKDGKYFYVELIKEEQKLSKKPHYLTIQFSRFTHDREKGSFKIHTPITNIPEQLDAKSFAIENSPSGTYELTSFIVHSGFLNGGHYIAYIKKEDRWIKCNDGSTFYVDKPTFLEDLSNSYMCFYKLKTK